MKKIHLSFVALILTINFSYAQWSGSPGPISYSGNAGLGTYTLSGGANARWLTLDGVSTYGGGIISSVMGVPKGFSYYDSNTNAMTLQALTGIDVSLWPGGTVSPALTVKANGSVGIGTAAPGEKLTVAGNAQLQGTYPYLALLAGAWANNAYIQAGVDPVGSTGGNYLAFLNPAAKGFSFSQGSVARMVIDPATGNVGVGTMSPDEKLTVNGAIHSTEVKVTANVPLPDYVFNPGYRLPDLTEVKSYINEHHHLPEIPAATEMETNGIALGEMNTRLLKKVEELTLYLIDQQKTIESMQQQLKKLKFKSSRKK